MRFGAKSEPSIRTLFLIATKKLYAASPNVLGAARFGILLIISYRTLQPVFTQKDIPMLLYSGFFLIPSGVFLHPLEFFQSLCNLLIARGTGKVTEPMV